MEVKLILTEIAQADMNKFLPEITNLELENILILKLILRLIRMKTKIIHTIIDDLQVKTDVVIRHQKMVIQTNLITSKDLQSYIAILLKIARGSHKEHYLSKEILNQAE